MRLASKTHYGIQILVYLALAPGEDWVSLRSLSQELHLSLPFLKHIAATLKKSRILKSQGGMHGGYRLGLAPEAISLSSIFKSLNEPIKLTPCKARQCSHQKCVTGSFWESVTTNIQSAFDQTTLATILETQTSIKE